jgi:hypothetical protein
MRCDLVRYTRDSQRQLEKGTALVTVKFEMTLDLNPLVNPT